MVGKCKLSIFYALHVHFDSYAGRCARAGYWFATIIKYSPLSPIICSPVSYLKLLIYLVDTYIPVN